MNRIFLYIGTGIGVIVLIMTVMLTAGNNPENEEVKAGFALWKNYGCESCHTLYGQGGNYAPDLTHIYNQRGGEYIQAFIVSPSAYHPDERVMPRFPMTQTEITQIITMFEWTANTDSIAGEWPPNPIRVSGSAGLTIPRYEESESSETSETSDPLIDRGQTIYSQRCASCHSIADGVLIVGPSFWNIANTAEERIDGQDAREYLRNSILNPSDYVVEGFNDVMQKNLGEVLSSDDINGVIAFLMSFDGEEE